MGNRYCSRSRWSSLAHSPTSAARTTPGRPTMMKAARQPKLPVMPPPSGGFVPNAQQHPEQPALLTARADGLEQGLKAGYAQAQVGDGGDGEL